MRIFNKKVVRHVWNIIKKWLNKQSLKAAFTLIEMVIVLFIISVLLLLFVPNLIEKGNVAQKRSNYSVVEVVKQEIQVYKAEHGQEPSEDTLKGIVGKRRYDIYVAHKNDPDPDESSPSG